MATPEKRIQDDIDFFTSNLNKINITQLDKTNQEIIKLAQQYHADAQYYLKKQDYLTAFGCINYAHGLLDAILKKEQ